MGTGCAWRMIPLTVHQLNSPSAIEASWLTKSKQKSQGSGASKHQPQRPKTTLLLVEKNSRPMLLTTGNTWIQWSLGRSSSNSRCHWCRSPQRSSRLWNTFFNWSNSIADQEKFAAALKQDEDGTFPIARKLVDLAKYYGFDGYFINQETTGNW